MGVHVRWFYEDGSTGELQKTGADTSSRYGVFGALSKMTTASEGDSLTNWRIGAGSKMDARPTVRSGDAAWKGTTATVTGQLTQSPDMPGVGLVWMSIAVTADHEKFQGEWLEIIIEPSSPILYVGRTHPEKEIQSEPISSEPSQQHEATETEEVLQRLRDVYANMKAYIETELSQELINSLSQNIDPHQKTTSNSNNTSIVSKHLQESPNKTEGGLLWSKYEIIAANNKTLSNEDKID